MRQIVLDTETTGLDPTLGHRIIEIGCVEMINRKQTGNNLHLYINPERDIEAGAQEVHGLTIEFLADKPVFAAIADTFIEFVQDAELIIHNAPFDIAFLDSELGDLNRGYKSMQDYCSILDTLALARNKHPGQKNNLDALCKRYFIDNSQRTQHGALLDAEILAEVYLTMTGGQSSLALGRESEYQQQGGPVIQRTDMKNKSLKIIRAGADEIEAHLERLSDIERVSGKISLWQQQIPEQAHKKGE